MPPKTAKRPLPKTAKRKSPSKDKPAPPVKVIRTEVKGHGPFRRIRKKTPASQVYGYARRADSDRRKSLSFVDRERFRRQSLSMLGRPPREPQARPQPQPSDRQPRVAVGCSVRVVHGVHTGKMGNVVKSLNNGWFSVRLSTNMSLGLRRYQFEVLNKEAADARHSALRGGKQRERPWHQAVALLPQSSNDVKAKQEHLPVNGHYDVLQIGRGATLAVIRKAYRARALITHPDKGGDPEEFRKVFDAFETLADVARREVYESRLDADRIDDGRRWSSEVPGKPAEYMPSTSGSLSEQMFAASLRKSFDLLHKEDQADPTDNDIREFSYYDLQILQGLVRKKDPPPWLASPPPTPSPGLCIKKGDKGYKCLFFIQREQAYRIDLHWNNLQVRTLHTRCLEQAVDWQIALICMREKALHRIAQVAQASQQSLHDVDPLTQQELSVALSEQPTMNLTFTVTFYERSIKHTRMYYPATKSLRLALAFRRDILSGPVSLKQLASKKKKAFQETQEEKQAFPVRCQQILCLVDNRLLLMSQRAAEKAAEKAAAARGERNQMLQNTGLELVDAQRGSDRHVQRSNRGSRTDSGPRSRSRRRDRNRDQKDKNAKLCRTDELQVGARVLLWGLSRAVDLNGKFGTCEAYDSRSQRWIVRVDNDSESKNVLIQNLQLVSLPSESPALLPAPMTPFPGSSGRHSIADGRHAQVLRREASSPVAPGVEVGSPRSGIRHTKGKDHCESRPDEPPFLMHKISGGPPSWNDRSALRYICHKFCDPNLVRIFSGLTLRDLTPVSAVSIGMRQAWSLEIWQRLRWFVYTDQCQEFLCPPTRSRMGRIIRSPDSSSLLKTRLSAFLFMHAKAFEKLQLHSVPIPVLESQEMRNALSRLPHVSQVSLPVHGWSSSTSKKYLMKALKKGVTFEMRDARRVVSLGEIG